MTTKEYLDIMKIWATTTEEIRQKAIQFNKDLVAEYPFLDPRPYYGYENVANYDFTWTLMDDVPDGWRLAFGDELLKNLKEELIKNDFLEDYQIYEIKEKYGTLRWYDNFYSENWNHNLRPRYDELSSKTCIDCGKPAKWRSTGWISPYCDSCKKRFKDIENWVRIEE